MYQPLQKNVNDYNPDNNSHFLLLQDYFPDVWNWFKLRYGICRHNLTPMYYTQKLQPSGTTLLSHAATANCLSAKYTNTCGKRWQKQAATGVKYWNSLTNNDTCLTSPLSTWGRGLSCSSIEREYCEQSTQQKECKQYLLNVGTHVKYHRCPEGFSPKRGSHATNDG